MAVITLENGNTTFGVRNGIEPGLWWSAHFYAMHLTGAERAELRTVAKSNTAMFTREQVLSIAEQLVELANRMPTDCGCEPSAS